MKARPTLKEVCKQFENAKEIECLMNGFIFDVSKSELKTDVCKYGKEYFLDTPTDCPENLLIWSKCKGYAKIISYKEPIYQITKEQILELKNGYKTEKLREWFPNVFKY